MSSTPKFSDKDLTHLVKSFEKPVPAPLRAKVMARIDEIDRKRTLGSEAPMQKRKEIKREGRDQQ